MALVESRHDAMAGLVLTNPVVESENVEPEVQILEDGRGMLGTGCSSIVYPFFSCRNEYIT